MIKMTSHRSLNYELLLFPAIFSGFVNCINKAKKYDVSTYKHVNKTYVGNWITSQ